MITYKQAAEACKSQSKNVSRVNWYVVSTQMYHWYRITCMPENTLAWFQACSDELAVSCVCVSDLPVLTYGQDADTTQVR